MLPPDADDSITVTPGNRLPGIPPRQITLGATCHGTDEWTLRAVLIAQSSQFLFGDEANPTLQLPRFIILNLTSHQLKRPVLCFGR